MSHLDSRFAQCIDDRHCGFCFSQNLITASYATILGGEGAAATEGSRLGEDGRGNALDASGNHVAELAGALKWNKIVFSCSGREGQACPQTSCDEPCFAA